MQCVSECVLCSRVYEFQLKHTHSNFERRTASCSLKSSSVCISVWDCVPIWPMTMSGQKKTIVLLVCYWSECQLITSTAILVCFIFLFCFDAISKLKWWPFSSKHLTISGWEKEISHWCAISTTTFDSIRSVWFFLFCSIFFNLVVSVKIPSPIQIKQQQNRNPLSSFSTSIEWKVYLISLFTGDVWQFQLY